MSEVLENNFLGRIVTTAEHVLAMKCLPILRWYRSIFGTVLAIPPQKKMIFVDLRYREM